MRAPRAILLALGATTLIGAAGHLAGRPAYDHFDHWQHRRVFPTCQGCHAGAQDSTRSIWPAVSDCAKCHDGTIEKKVDWSPPTTPRPSNLRFTHQVHARKAAERLPQDSVVCTSCHLAEGAPWMRVRRSEVPRCLACHGVRAEHLAAANTTCGTCHVPLAEATALPRERIAHFPAPPYHFDASFPLAHADFAQPPPDERGALTGVSPSCATCHARDFCITCHVNAPEVPAIQALAPDPRSLAIEAKLEAPASHAAPEFIQRHGEVVRRDPESCATCHTQEELPDVPRGPAVGRGRDARGGTRTGTWGIGHPPTGPPRMETTSPTAMRGSHRRRPEAVRRATPAPTAWTATAPTPHRHRDTTRPASSRAIRRPRTRVRPRARSATTPPPSVPTAISKRGSRQGDRFAAATMTPTRASCSDTGRPHDRAWRAAFRAMLERDCLTCHSAAGGRRFDPHGPGFDANRLRSRNPEMCAVCHVGEIPER